MKGFTPVEAITNLIIAMKNGALDELLTLYEPGATFVPKPGVVVTGTASLREAFAGFLTLKPTLTIEKHEVVEAGDIAMCCSRWNLKGTDPDGKPVEMNGCGADVFRRQEDGSWLFVIDNPWGAGIVSD